jgi:hypothetical protein
VTRIHRLILAGTCALALAVGLAACGGSSDSSSAASPGNAAATSGGAKSQSTGGGSAATTGGTATAGVHRVRDATCRSDPPRRSERASVTRTQLRGDIVFARPRGHAYAVGIGRAGSP